MKKTFCALFILSLLTAACKKDEPTPSEILTAATCWKITLLEGYESGAGLWLSVPVEDCIADNCFSFKTDQTFSVDEGAAKCDPNDAQTSTGGWSISPDGKQLSLTDDQSSDTGNIISIEKDKLVYEVNFDQEKIRFTMETR
ncbi:MAG: lipocalin family protein [Chitinophagales bacterium]|nr:lipocalin family protein [Chitinophagales bacterium]